MSPARSISHDSLAGDAAAHGRCQGVVGPDLLDSLPVSERETRIYTGTGDDGTLVVVTHDRTFLDAIEPTRELAL